MLRNTRKGFTLIELLIVVVIIGILAAIAIPKFAATKDKAKLASVKTDVRNIMSAMEGRASDNGSYVALTPPNDFTLSNGNTMDVDVTVTNAGAGYNLAVTNASITTGDKTCSVAVGGASGANDGKIICAP